MINDDFTLTGALTIKLNDEVVQETNNLVVTAGKNWVANRLKDQTATITAGSFVTGTSYTILTVGSTDFTSIGASANTVGVTFVATGVGTGTGTARTFTQEEEMTHMALGTGDTAAAAGDTTLATELDRNTTGSTVLNNAITYETTWAAGDGTGAIKEAGIFNAASAGDMLARTVFSVVNKGANDSMTITWTVTVS